MTAEQFKALTAFRGALQPLIRDPACGPTAFEIQEGLGPRVPLTSKITSGNVLKVLGILSERPELAKSRTRLEEAWAEVVRQFA